MHRGSKSKRVVLTVLFTDIVESTKLAAELGDRKWRKLLDRHNAMVRAELTRNGGRELPTTGDGFVATFEVPERGIRCALAAAKKAGSLGIDIRAGLHTGELDPSGKEPRGIAMHIAARVASLAAAGEVLVSRTARDLVTGSGIEFTDRGAHALKGVPGRWDLFAVSRISSRKQWSHCFTAPDSRPLTSPTASVRTRARGSPRAS